MNILQQILEGIIGGPAKGAEKPMARPMKPLAHMAQKKFVPTENDPEYYAQNGLASNEAEAQAMVNAYREQQNPGINPLFPAQNFGGQPQYISPVIGASPLRPGKTPYSPGEGPRIPRR